MKLIMLEQGLSLLVPVKENCDATVSKDILDKSVLPNLFGEEQCLGVMVRCLYMFGYTGYLTFL